MKIVALGSLLMFVSFTGHAQKGIRQTERKHYFTQIKATESLLRLNETGKLKGKKNPD